MWDNELHCTVAVTRQAARTAALAAANRRAMSSSPLGFIRLCA
jgi:hypothetical protein